MPNRSMQMQQESSYLSGGNADYIEALYEQYLENPQSVTPEWQHHFEQIAQKNGSISDVSHAQIRAQFLQLAKEGAVCPVAPADSVAAVKAAKVAEFIEAYRAYGHYLAQLDPLKLEKLPKRPELELRYYGLNDADLNEVFRIPNFGSGQPVSLANIYNRLKEIYNGSIGVEYMYLSNFAERDWVQNQFEIIHTQLQFSNEQKQRILKKLTAAEGLERFLGTKYVGQKRFSLEGADTLIPMLDSLIQRAGDHYSVKEVVIGMSHRGRLNVLINVLGKPPRQLFDAFEGKVSSGRSDDVKYHLGASNNIRTGSSFVHVVLAFNPSHLEIVNPVVEGSVRARQERRGDAEGLQVMPVLIHGDAAFSGQGVVMETLNLSQISGYYTGGTVHIVINNQVGFTTDPSQLRSSFYCTDAAKMIEAPVFHVNGDDPEAVMIAIQTALDFRMTFKKDVVIDLVCFRRHGHNEADEPAATQPLMYQKIKQHLGIRKLYADQLIKKGVTNSEAADQLVAQYRDSLERGENILEDSSDKGEGIEFLADWKPYLDQPWRQEISTGISLESLKTLGKALQIPKTFTLQPQVAKVMEERYKMFAGEIPVNWGCAETLAYARLLVEGYPIRIAGQDAQRGTFAHRHAVLHNYTTGETYTPLAQLAKAPAKFSVIDSLLSEEAVLGYEYGFSMANPNALVIWEAQYGDFANGAQVVIDQFISSGEQKWGRLCGLVMFLPHGYEGSGPEHSSARLERYLQLCAQHNIQVCIPTTPAQIFHLISRQMLRPYRKPLIVMTPKSLLRHKLVVSSLNDLVSGEFQLIIPETETIERKTARRVILCSGKIYYDLLEKRHATQQKDVALVRIEQLYPFPEEELSELLENYKNTKDIVWCQEESKNQGAWYAMEHRMVACLAKGQKLAYVGRSDSASPAVGYMFMHVKEQNALLEKAFA
jgi:2-oxoglutarate dehydrogenase E1 component